ncbi:SOS response-associated peptidase family protein [Streptomyces mirabilis]|uniref:SOS response-associated peptidase family protein n=1 Tax=Streptomyces mirabilis TaxID=68239 RepID=UPI00368A4A3A
MLPVKLMSATEDRSVRFHQVHTEDLGRVRVREYCETEDREVSVAEIGKGYEVSKDTLVAITDEELEQMPLPTAKAIEIVAFVPAASIDPVRLSGDSYFLQYDGQVAAKPYALVTDWRAEEALAPNWNVAPTNNVWAVLERVPRDQTDATAVQRELRPLRWGLVPSWAKDMKIGARMINARVETVHEKPAYRRAFAKRRCLLPADGFYEWEQAKDPDTGKAHKQPYFIHPEDQQVMALAGLYEYWRNPEVKQDDDPAAWLTTCSIITTEATDTAGRVHPRMPLALTPDHYDSWLDPHHQDPDELRALLTQPAGGHLDARPVSTAVNNVRNNGPQLLDAITR